MKKSRRSLSSGLTFARSLYRCLKSRCLRGYMLSLPERWRSSRVLRRWLSCFRSTTGGTAWRWGINSRRWSYIPRVQYLQMHSSQHYIGSVSGAGGSAWRPRDHLCFLAAQELASEALKPRNSLGKGTHSYDGVFVAVGAICEKFIGNGVRV